ncbi:distal tail protein Dit [Clostridium pasteurianum]|uniref:Phage putative tail component n=1 Tax=Clostridium pasteurianum BC1 TaxID=86416 RepID=R4K8X7_CLOPA|nr:distal tail protein Dit [Clostridium pasteurianum]AGK98161.1 phage putative tail component [Clostridium pasteurianum BC1]
MITFNGKEETDIDEDIRLVDRQLTAPTKKKIKDTVPFMSGYYDFSTVGSGGEIVYDNRQIQCKFGIKGKSKQDLQNKYNKFLRWIYDVGQSQLQFDDKPGIFFMAEVEREPTWKETFLYGESTVTFICEPFAEGNTFYGELLWDDIDFDLPDYIEETSFTITGSQTVTIYNPGKPVVPDVIVSSNMSCTLNSYTANFTTSNSKDPLFRLLSGSNTISVTGNGIIDFNFRKVVL